jgi:hypothetical protein
LLPGSENAEENCLEVEEHCEMWGEDGCWICYQEDLKMLKSKSESVDIKSIGHWKVHGIYTFSMVLSLKELDSVLE